MKRIITSIVITITLLGLVFAVCRLTTKDDTAISKGSITITLVDENKKSTKKTIEYEEGTTFRQILDNNYDIEIVNGFLYRIDDLYCPNEYEYFIKIIINCELSNYGVDNFKFNNHDEIIFRVSSVEDHYNGC